MSNQEAVIVRQARKRYGKGQPVLDGLSMVVTKGTIYGLLGASGCGKTTLLSCIVGVKKLDSGDIWVLGGQPDSSNSGIPGPRVGYMPQDIALVQEFSVIGALLYFGRINGMSDDEIEDEYYFLSNLLNLPPRNRLVRDLSGGQQRRVSFAAALIHKPELLILDEPTVGLDPILREKIWDYLIKITQELGTTVIITTHYIEEAKLANKIGLLRCGKLLAEASPAQLLDRFQCPSLEEAFLILSQRQKLSQERGTVDPQTNYFTEMDDFSHQINRHQYIIQNEKEVYNNVEYIQKDIKKSALAIKKFRALMIKNLMQFVRHPGGVLFAIVLPIVQVFLFFNTIGGDPTGFNLGIINHEAGNCDFGANKGFVFSIDPEFKSCQYVNLSCRFLNAIEDSFVGKVFYNDSSTIKEDVKHNKIIGVIHFPYNFSQSFQMKLENPTEMSTEDLLSSEITVSLDMGNRATGLHLQKEIFKRYHKAIQEIFSECDISPRLLDSPVQFEKPVWGDMDPNITHFMIPTFLLTVIFFLSTSVSSTIIISDRYEGVWERSLVQGVRTSEILLAHILTQFLVVMIQVACSLMMAFLIYGIECLGSFFVVIALNLAVGFSGMCYGFLISVFCSSQSMANYLTTGTFYPVIILCGCIWPVDGMPMGLKWLSLSLPTTLPGISLRYVLEKGYPINDPEVYSGFLVISGWTVGLVALCFVGLKTKSK